VVEVEVEVVVVGFGVESVVQRRHYILAVFYSLLLVRSLCFKTLAIKLWKINFAYQYWILQPCRLERLQEGRHMTESTRNGNEILNEHFSEQGQFPNGEKTRQDDHFRADLRSRSGVLQGFR